MKLILNLKPVVFTLLMLCSLDLAGQTKVLKITSPNTKREIIIQDNKRVRIKTHAGKTLSGRLHILSTDSLQIKRTKFALTDVAKIKRQPLVLTIAFNSILYFYGTSAFAGGILIAAIYSEGAALLISAVGAGMLYSAITSVNVLKAYKTSKQWQYTIVELPD